MHRADRWSSTRRYCLACRKPTDVLGFLPVNHRVLVRACLDQQRAIEGVEAQFEEQILI
jgi:hypothetical protein